MLGHKLRVRRVLLQYATTSWCKTPLIPRKSKNGTTGDELNLLYRPITLRK